MQGGEILENLVAWDSLAVIGFIAVVDENYGINVSPSGIKLAKTIDDLFALLNH
jgi:acyl carrier protein